LVAATIIGVIILMVGILLPQILDAFPNLIPENKPFDPTRFNWPMILAGLLYTLLPLSLLWAKRRRYPALLDNVDEAQNV
jgi:carbon starvation protein CstA